MPVRALNLYYARDEGARAQVLATRLRATDVRERIGVPRGRVFTRKQCAGDWPDVMWDCPFADARAHDHDMQARAASVEFERSRAVMRTLTRRFERVIYEQVAVLEAPDVAPGAQLVQIWIIGDGTAGPDIEALRSTPAAAIFRRTDDNTRLPEWIVELPVDDNDRTSAIDEWIARHPGMQSAVLRWKRVA